MATAVRTYVRISTQLNDRWRVTETSHILLLLADARCPALHLPNSLRTYVQNLQHRKEVILVLTKSDLVEQDALDGWKQWVLKWWDKGGGLMDVKEKHEIQIVTVQSLSERLEVGGESLRKNAFLKY